MKIKCIKETDKMPKGYKYLTSWEFEELFNKRNKLFLEFEKSCYYALINPKGSRCRYRYFWNSCYDFDGFQISGSGNLNFCGRSRGVLIWKK